jgi:hypothetical protein
LIFRGVTSSGAITDSLCESRIPRIYKILARKAGIDESVLQSISGHSMRVGGAQDLLSVGVSLPQIMVKGGWAKTDTAMRYVERTSHPMLFAALHQSQLTRGTQLRIFELIKRVIRVGSF